MDFDNPKVYGDTSISDGLVHHVMAALHHHNYGSNYPTSFIDASTDHALINSIDSGVIFLAVWSRHDGHLHILEFTKSCKYIYSVCTEPERRKNSALLTCNLFGIWATELWLMDPQPVCQYFTFVTFLVLYIAKKTHCCFWWPELMQMVPPAGSSPFGANGRGWTYLENFHHFTAKELELAHSLNSRGSSSLRTETSLVMMCESYPSCCIIACNLS